MELLKCRKVYMIDLKLDNDITIKVMYDNLWEEVILDQYDDNIFYQLPKTKQSDLINMITDEIWEI